MTTWGEGKKAIIGGLANIEMTSGVSEQHKGFVTVRATGEYAGEPVILLGQLTPDEMRAHALAYLEAAEAAESDAAVFAEMTEGLRLDPGAVGAFVAALRARRAGQA